MIPRGKIPLEEGTAAHPRILSWRIPMGRGAWWAAVRGVAKTGTGLPQLSTHVYCLMKSEALKWDSELLQFSSVQFSRSVVSDSL